MTTLDKQQARQEAEALIDRVGRKHWAIELQQTMGGGWFYYLRLKNVGTLTANMRPLTFSTGLVYRLEMHGAGPWISHDAEDPETLLPTALRMLGEQLEAMQTNYAALTKAVGRKPITV